MSDLSDELRAAAEQIVDRIGVDTETPAAGWSTEVWEALRESGFTDIGVDDEEGSFTDLLTVIAAVSAAGAVTPLIEHTALAHWLATRAGLELSATTTVAIADDGCVFSESGSGTTLTGTVTDVALTGAAMVLVAVPTDDEITVGVIDPAATGVSIQAGTDLVGAPYGDIDFTDVAAQHCGRAAISVEQVRERGALAYATALAAAATRVRDTTVAYAGDRTQFGRPLTKFQAIQQRLAQLAATTALMETAATTAARQYQTGSTDADTAVIAAAKTVTSACAREVAAAGHQIHGAIGFTSEHALGRATTSLWTWRDRYGTEQEWARVLAGQIVDDGADVWDIIVGAEPTVRQDSR
ncbi:acyl-CoA dehydrogenase family protein [Gordonia sp. CPCC 205515]|uniref:acyl-CoA dehydrogenase family protein n=1 Tax=Gordonia sp. CPCC 205515 TaxID=3140791 RepID=UPI003AF33211